MALEEIEKITFVTNGGILLHSNAFQTEEYWGGISANGQQYFGNPDKPKTEVYVDDLILK